MIPTITIRDAARLVGIRTDKPGRTAKQLTQAIKYSLDKKPEDWTAAGINPEDVQRRQQSEYTETIAAVMGWPSPEEVRKHLAYDKADAAAGDALAAVTKAAKELTTRGTTFPKHTHNQGEEVYDYIPSHPAIIHPADDPDPKFRKQEPGQKQPAPEPEPAPVVQIVRDEATPLADVIGGRFVKLSALAVVLLADFVACGLNWWTHLADKPDNIRTGAALAFGFVGIIIGLAGFVNFIKIKDEETANVFAFVFGAYQLTIHGVLLFTGYSFIGCGAEIIGLVFVPSAILTVIRQEAR